MQIHDNVNAAIDAEMQEIFARIEQDKPVARMSEVYFRENFLPFLRPEGIPEEHMEIMLARLRYNLKLPPNSPQVNAATLRGNMLSHWLEKVGSMYMECEVYNENNEIVFVVPPFFNANDQLSSEDASQLPMLVENAYNQGQILPMMATHYINQQILPLFHIPEGNVEILNQWNKIYAYYGIPPVGPDVAKENLNEVETKKSIEMVDDAGWGLD